MHRELFFYDLHLKFIAGTKYLFIQDIHHWYVSPSSALFVYHPSPRLFPVSCLVVMATVTKDSKGYRRKET